jgi:hypothetical protein
VLPPPTRAAPIFPAAATALALKLCMTRVLLRLLLSGLLSCCILLHMLLFKG